MHFDHENCITYMYTQRPPDDEEGGHTMHRDKVPSHMYHKICTYQRDATTLFAYDRSGAGAYPGFEGGGFIANTKINMQSVVN